MHKLLSFFLFLIPFSGLNGQCPNSTVTVEITTDFYPYELSWTLNLLNGTELESVSLQEENTGANETVSWDVCVDEGECAVFSIFDSYGDGIFQPGGYKLYLDGALLVESGFSGSESQTTINCGPGESCLSGDTITIGTHVSQVDDHWYVFVPDTSGQFELSTCELNTCDTKIWVYDNCDGFESVEDNQGTLFYDDNFGGCGEQAFVLAEFAAGTLYYIRVGDDMDACADPITWELSYLGPIMGCTNPSACNYNPAASLDDGSCIYQPSPECPQAPDLLLDQDQLISSLYLASIDNDDPCLIEEGCLTGYGKRDIIRFSTVIANIGDLDYFIGEPDENSDQFTFNNCHNHWHYDGYAEYLLFDEDGQELAIGFKNGFCVIDLGCTTGSPQYNCNYMGITAGCYDEYWAELECQWIDLTDVPDGDYTFVTRVNWDNAPDALGRYEKDTLNNWAQACIRVDRSFGDLTFQLIQDCPTYTDCLGEPYGNAQIDCKGECGGASLQGDLNDDGTQDADDVQMYAEGIMSGSIELTNCSDISSDGQLDVMDVSLLASCLTYGNTHVHQATGPHDHCRFGLDISTDEEWASLAILDHVPGEYVDIGLKNPSSQVVAYQFSMSGFSMASAESLLDPVAFSAQPMIEPISKQVMGFSTDTTVIERSPDFIPLLRIHILEESSDSICIVNIKAIINSNIHRVNPEIENGCSLISSVTETLSGSFNVFPNPAKEKIHIQWEDISVEMIQVIDVFGVQIYETPAQLNRTGDLQVKDLPKGVYFAKLISPDGFRTAKFLVQ
ncbi:MAG: T9SS type A sorting domain-containing protein [Saprospiraceae bacterium]|nr:T9SS type A sorting domain-containing protein [Saprospiraceae bacterium]